MTTKVTMPFGKHAGVPLTELPDHYLAWLLTPAIELREPLKGLITEEATRRDRVRDAERAAALVTDDVIEAANEIIKQGVRALMRTRHPDAGGSTDAMQAVNNAAELLRATLNDIASRPLR
jgi:Putative quorum-sensing-regulated virulence factor